MMCDQVGTAPHFMELAYDFYGVPPPPQKPSPLSGILSLFGVPDLEPILSEHQAIIAGGAALHAYLKRDPETFDGDLDIWFQADTNYCRGSTSPTNCECGFKYVTRQEATNFWSGLLNAYDYQHIKRPLSRNLYGSAGRYIKCFLDFEHALTKRKIQVMATKIPAKDIVDTFDFSCCATWWVPGSPAVETLCPEMTDRLEFTLISESNMLRSTRFQQRRRRYELRGFKFLQPSWFKLYPDL
eukprot:gnl/Hemi2/368_TR115_c0_g1_i1.p1 gnl/Hemi2/368_TR115_c0_g1~~gnl/Hemi2/368_TR115_c0_g1_i1.p1  ORF type:complete len:241 (+),score=20.54 gnl/Hemi2/368_TR115_c0_g1_i1:29-751(+)